jgi:dTDP-4-dehydrorhamnose 3,5-epimerase-like enzyme
MQEVIFLKRITKVNLDLGISIDFVQDNQSFQRDATWFTLSKSSFCSNQTRTGATEIIDVAVDLRKDSTFGKHFLFCYLLRIKQLLVPQGFAHGFQYLAKPLWCYTNVNITIKRAKAASDLMIQLWLLTGNGLKNAIVSEKTNFA